MEQNPLVSVVMPAYNAESYIAEAIQSVLDQTVTDWELLVMDDCSTDATCEVAEAYAACDCRILLLRNERNLGVARTRNAALDRCRGSYVAFLDSDDVWYPQKLERQIEKLRQTGANFCYTSYGIVDSCGMRVRTDYLVPEQVGFDDLLKENVIGCSTVLLDESAAKQHRFLEDFYHEDYVLWLTLLKEGFTACGCKEPLVKWRYLENSRSFNKTNSAKNRWKIYREYLGLSVFESARCFFKYAVRGMKKYRRKRR